MADRVHGRHRSCSCYRSSSQGSGRRSQPGAAEHHHRRSRQRSRDSRYSARSGRSRSSRWRSPSTSDEGSCSSGSSGRRSSRHGGRSLRRGNGARPSRRASPARAVPDAGQVPGPSAPQERQQPGIQGAPSGSGSGGPPVPQNFVGYSDPGMMTLVGSSVTPATWQGHVHTQVTAGGRSWNLEEGLEGDMPAWCGWRTTSGFRRQ